MDSIHAYCDGACSGNPGPGGWGAVLILPEGVVKELGGGERPTTNNRMEMLGAISALRATADRPEPVKLFTDSSYVVSGITMWVHGWRRRGWQTMDGKPVLNRDLWETLMGLAAARRDRLTWVQVKGHAGHEVNERCDEIAVAYSKNQNADLYEGPAIGCGYSLLEPGPAHLRAPGGPRKPSSPKPKGGWYLSWVGGKLEKHTSWPECQARVSGVSGAKFKKVSSPEEEKAALEGWGV
ncbi:MAG: ribonuclease HI [Elusimicrobia bacterium]|nr:ribonuclease HI [Elusimicrobiota bacterium]